MEKTLQKIDTEYMNFRVWNSQSDRIQDGYDNKEFTDVDGLKDYVELVLYNTIKDDCEEYDIAPCFMEILLEHCLEYVDWNQIWNQIKK